MSDQTKSRMSQRAKKRRETWLKDLIAWHSREANRHFKLGQASADGDADTRMDHRFAATRHEVTVKFLRELS